MSWSFQMKKFFKDESGATAIEYGLIAAATGLALIGVMPTLSANLGDDLLHDRHEHRWLVMI
jgi:pilus assembly protein Flp/PilA